MTMLNAIHGNPATIACLDMARHLAPPHAVIHVGAGHGHGSLHHWQHWPVAHARLIDADDTRLQWMERHAARHAPLGLDWLALGSVVADRDGEVEFHPTSHPAEDSLLPVSMLQAVWPNLRALPRQPRHAERLDTLLLRHPVPAAEAGTLWLIIECLPALRILEGAPQTLASAQVVCLRVLLDEQRIDDEKTTLQAAANYLEQQGFQCVHVGETNHPAVGEALFLRDQRQQFEQQAGQLNQQIQALQQQTQQLAQERDAQAQLAAEREQKLQKITVDRETEQKTAASQRQQLEQKLQTLEKTSAEQRTQLEQRAQNLEQAANEQRQQFEQQAAQLNQQIQALQQQIQQITQSRDNALQQVREQETRLQAQEAQNQELQHRQHLMQEEMIKAEAQIELIKDLLLREPGL